MDALNLIEGEWYFAVRCRNCDVQFAFKEEGEIDEGAYFTNSAKVVLTCIDCQIPLAYSGEEIVRVRAG